MPDKTTVDMVVALDLDSITEALLKLDPSDIFDFMVALDLQMADYDFTKKLAEHLTAEVAKCDAECGVTE